MMAKKEEKIKKLLEEEKAAREFHANPIPKGKLVRYRGIVCFKPNTLRALLQKIIFIRPQQ